MDTKKQKAAMDGIINPITADRYEEITDLWNTMKESDSWYIIEEILQHGKPELSVFVETSIHKYKARYDAVTDSGIYDWKTITKAYWNERSIKSQIVKLGYDISAAMYQWVEFQRTGIWKDFSIVWIMKEKPFDVLVSKISDFAYLPIKDGKDCVKCSGAIAFEKLKTQHEACEMAGSWKGLSASYENGIATFEPSYDRNINEFETE